MEFEEMKKIWDSQNNETLYVINEDALHKSVTAKKRKATRLASMDEIGLMIISVLTGSYLTYSAVVNEEGFLNYLGGVLMGLIGVYVFWLRVQRKKGERKFDRSILGEIDHAISSTESNIRLGATMIWWYFLPLGVWIAGVFVSKRVEWFYWLSIGAMFLLAYVVTQVGLNRFHKPRLMKLMKLREKLMEEV